MPTQNTDNLKTWQQYRAEFPPRRRGHRIPTTLLGLGLLASLLLGAAFFSHAFAVRTDRPRLTHTVARGDLVVSVTATGLVQSAENVEIKNKVRGRSMIIWVIENGTYVNPGQELVRLDAKRIEDAVNERTKYAHWSRASAEQWRANVASAKLAIPEYVEGQFQTQLMTLEKELIVAQSNLRTAQSLLAHTEMMAKSGYVSDLDVEQKRLSVQRAELAVENKRAEIDVLKQFTKAMELQRLQGNLEAAEAQLAAAEERAEMDATRRDIALDELQHTTIRAERSGLVIYPTAAPWEQAPEIEQGATVYKDQVLLLMPDLSQLQVKVQIHESMIERIQPGLPVRVVVAGDVLEGTVDSVASVAAPSGWWNAHRVMYDTLIRIPARTGLMPGMSAQVEILLATYHDVLTLPVAAIVESEDGGTFCWVTTQRGPRRRPITLGDTNDVFTVLKSGLTEGDHVILNPLALERTDADSKNHTNNTTSKDAAPSPREPQPPSGRQTTLKKNMPTKQVKKQKNWATKTKAFQKAQNAPKTK